MYKVLIADDESIICHGICESLNWASMNMEIADTACNGREALEKMVALRPDICLLDVRMPFMSGLEVARTYLADNPDAIVILITGHDDFNYAKTAIEIGVSGYILKPVDEEELEATVLKAKKRLDDLALLREQQRQTDTLLEQNSADLRQVFYRKWLAAAFSPEELRDNLGIFGIRLAAATGVLFVRLLRDKHDEFLSPEALEQKVAELERSAAALLEPRALIMRADDRTVAAVHAIGDGDWLELSVLLYNAVAAQGLQAHVIQRELPEPELLPQLYREADGEMRKTLALSPIVSAMKLYVEQNYKKPDVRLQAFAAAHNSTSSYLSRLFKQEMELSFVEYLNLYRIQKSLYYLANPHLRIVSIAENVGYSSQHYYCESFKRVMGFSPTEYRKQQLALGG